MHKLSAYERYIQHELERFDGWNNIPPWLILEDETCYWIFRLSRRMNQVLNSHIVPKRFIKQIEHIPTIRFLRYRDISPVLKRAVNDISAEFESLIKDLEKPEMWKKENLLSKAGIVRWQSAEELVQECRHVKPDPEWRKNWEKELLMP